MITLLFILLHSQVIMVFCHHFYGIRLTDITNVQVRQLYLFVKTTHQYAYKTFCLSTKAIVEHWCSLEHALVISPLASSMLL